MNHYKVKKDSHLLIFELNTSVPREEAQKVADQLLKQFPEFRMLVSQANMSLITLEESPQTFDNDF